MFLFKTQYLSGEFLVGQAQSKMVLRSAPAASNNAPSAAASSKAKQKMSAAPPAKKQPSSTSSTASKEKKAVNATCPCWGCGNHPASCHNTLFGKFARSHMDAYADKEAAGATLHEMEMAFQRGYNHAYHYHKFIWNGKIIDETTTVEPSACVWRLTFAPAVKDWCDSIAERVSDAVECLVNEKLFNEE